MENLEIMTKDELAQFVLDKEKFENYLNEKADNFPFYFDITPEIAFKALADLTANPFYVMRSVLCRPGSYNNHDIASLAYLASELYYKCTQKMPDFPYKKAYIKALRMTKEYLEFEFFGF